MTWFNDEVFFYDEPNDAISSLSKYHAEECSIEPLVEAHPEVIYFYAELIPYRDFNFNEVAITRDEYLIPLEDYTTPCGCKMRGRCLIEPCEMHREMFAVQVPVRDRRPLIQHRTCVVCGVKKPLNEECFEPKWHCKSGFRGICRKCQQKEE